MGLSLCVGIFADLEKGDSEAAEDFAEYFAFVGTLLEEAGLPRHVEPSDGEAWGAQMYGYSGLHYLRRIAAHLDAGLPLPPPGDDKSSGDPVLKAYFADALSQKPGWMQRPIEKQPRFARSFDHLIVHGDAEGFCLPQNFGPGRPVCRLIRREVRSAGVPVMTSFGLRSPDTPASATVQHVERRTT